jgi:DNA-binding MarR family transcriptional regulator
MQSTVGDAAVDAATGEDSRDSTPESSAVDSVMHALMSIGRLMSQRASGSALEPGTFWLLKTLAKQDSMRVTDLAGCANLDTSTVSRHVTQLHRAGLIDRTPDPDDGRAQRVGLSAEGRRTLQNAMDQRRAVLRRSFEGWDADDIQHLDRLLARFVSSIDNQNADLEQA